MRKFYIIEKTDDENKKIWQLKEAKIDEYLTFYSFNESLEKFMDLAKDDESSRVWFHQNGAFRGSMSFEKAHTALELLNEEKIESESATDYLVSKSLIESSSTKKEEKTEQQDTQEITNETKTYPTIITSVEEKGSKWFWVLIWILVVLILVCIGLTSFGIYKLYN
ncbi:hypothetical protein [Mycoplasma zalophi]|uniref:Uncharacterized protein n=1 Tax=Mycoplasma zalophi TaxID=191287 RepID=A0ABS6DQY8_9MOLU|nr:hypothetical protein [Mycoplasma zalophi]MBU4690855.1 hypothetical protein [Mycoplasma zalophi]MBU4692352.1 hypothetical protein [Mycoplasma zalophi]